MQLLILRHAETWANLEGRMQGEHNLLLRTGQLTELTPLGQQQAIALGQRLSRYPLPTQVHLSPLRRVQETWNHVPTPLVEQTVCLDFQLQELRQGIFSGLTWPEAEQRYPQLCQNLMGQPHWVPIPQAESPMQARQRAENWLERQLQLSTDADRVWIMTHGGFIPYLVSALLGSDRTWGLSVGLAALFEFELTLPSISKAGCDRHTLTLQQIRRFNDTSHWQLSS